MAKRRKRANMRGGANPLKFRGSRRGRDRFPGRDMADGRGVPRRPEWKARDTSEGTMIAKESGNLGGRDTVIWDMDITRVMAHIDVAMGALTGKEPGDHYVDMHVIRAKALGMMGQNTDAVRCLDGARDWLEKTEPGNGKAWEMLASSYGDAGKADKARSCRDAGSRGTRERLPGWKPSGGAPYEDPMVAIKYFLEGELRAIAGDHDLAVAYFERAAATEPSMFPAYYCLGLVKRKTGDLGAALSCFRRVLQAEPDLAIAHADMAETLYRMGKSREALECVDRALDLDPNINLAVYNKGTILSSMDRHQEAVLCFDRALMREPDMAMIHLRKGESLVLLDRYEDAIECFERALQLNPDDMSTRQLVQGLQVALEQKRLKESRE